LVPKVNQPSVGKQFPLELTGVGWNYPNRWFVGKPLSEEIWEVKKLMTKQGKTITVTLNPITPFSLNSQL